MVNDVQDKDLIQDGSATIKYFWCRKCCKRSHLSNDIDSDEESCYINAINDAFLEVDGDAELKKDTKVSSPKKMIGNAVFVDGKEIEQIAEKWFEPEKIKLAESEMEVQQKVKELQTAPSILRQHRTVNGKCSEIKRPAHIFTPSGVMAFERIEDADNEITTNGTLHQSKQDDPFQIPRDHLISFIDSYKDFNPIKSECLNWSKDEKGKRYYDSSSEDDDSLSEEDDSSTEKY